MMKCVKRRIISSLLAFVVMLSGALWTDVPVEAGMVNLTETISAGSSHYMVIYDKPPLSSENYGFSRGGFSRSLAYYGNQNRR